MPFSSVAGGEPSKSVKRAISLEQKPYVKFCTLEIWKAGDNDAGRFNLSYKHELKSANS